MAAFLLCWIWQYHSVLQAQQSLFADPMPVTGVITGTPRHFAEYSQFQLQLDSGPAQGYRVLLNWRLPEPLPEQGQRWQFNVRLKPVAGLANPGAANKEAAALLDKVLAQGNVDLTMAPILLGQQPSLRVFWLHSMARATADLTTGPLLLALALGEREFSAPLWLGIQQSGLAHLLAISGLHIGLVFGWAMLVLRLVPWPLSLLRWRQPVALLGALSLACGYAWLSGFAVPTVRATVALLVLVVALLQHRSFSYSHYWWLLAALLLLAEPFYALSKSFWLSMLALGVIFVLLWRFPPATNGWRSKVKLFLLFHLSLTLFMSLLSVLMFGGSASMSLLSNLLFVPWCSVIAIPLLFISLLAEMLALPGSSALWQLADLAFQPLLIWLDWCATYGYWLALPELSPLMVCCLALLLLLAYLCTRLLLMHLLPLLLLPLLLSFMRTPQWQLHVIDVGQGLAVLLQFGSRGMLYDAGPRYGSHSATASQVIPYLRQRGIRQLDYLLLSHDDSDHSGDWPLLQQYYPGVQVYSDISAAGVAGSCQQLPSQYLSASLHVLDAEMSYNSKNDNSCVLLIKLYGWTILLPGDISQRVELRLLQRYPQLRADVLLLAHHGSNSSSHLAFLHQLSPKMALNSASIYNRHQHPSVGVQQRLSMLGITLHNTAQSGALRLDISAEKLHLTPYRQQRIPFWLQKPLGNAETSDTTR
jgi:competence protein ComEC